MAKSRNTAQISVLIEPSRRAAMDELADEFGQALSDVLREVIDEGLPTVQARYRARRQPAVTEADRAARRG
jgi:hypothetical protein